MSEIQIDQTIDDKVLQEVMKVKNDILTAFIAEYSCKPSEIEVVENWNEDHSKLFWYVRKRDTESVE